MQSFNIQVRYVDDDRRWEDIPKSNDVDIIYQHISDGIKAMEEFLYVWNNLRQNENLKIFEIRLSTEWYNDYKGQGYYITDWSLYESHEERVQSLYDSA